MLKQLSTVTAFKNMKPEEGMIELSGQVLRDLQDVLLDILKDVAAVCEQNDIEYFLAGGTCLGAIRHKGFIPWDDDIDICMSRSSYERFREVFPRALADKYWLHDPRTKKDYSLGMPRVRKKGTVVKGRDDFLGDENGAFIDIFVVENIPSNAVLQKLHGIGSMAFGFGLSCRKFARFKDEYLKLAQDDETKKVFTTKIRLGKILSFASMDRWAQAWDGWNRMCKNDASRYVTIPVGRNHYFGELLERADLFPAVLADFEDCQFRVPANWDKYLSRLYGDYMVIPEENDREAHVIYEFDLGDGHERG